MTPDPLDYAFSWHLLCLLGALGALPPAALDAPQAAAARMSFIAQLEAVGGLAHWAVYAALHIPDAGERERVRRRWCRPGRGGWGCAGQLQKGAAVASWPHPRLALPSAIPPTHLPLSKQAQVVRELLRAHADEWADDDEAAAFLRDQLRLPEVGAWAAALDLVLCRIAGKERRVAREPARAGLSSPPPRPARPPAPQAWLAEAQALWAHYCADDAGRLDQLLAAQDWEGAHALLCGVVAPRWLLAGARGAGWTGRVVWQLQGRLLISSHRRVVGEVSTDRVPRTLRHALQASWAACRRCWSSWSRTRRR